MHFNDDMKILGLNAFQMSDLIAHVQEENDIIYKALMEQENVTI